MTARLRGVPKDTSTRFQGVYARHRLGCGLEAGVDCSCEPGYWGKVWDRAAGCHRKTRLVGSPTAARGLRADLAASLAAGQLPAASGMRVKAACEAFLLAAETGAALNKHGRRYKSSAVRDLRGALVNHVQPAFGAKRIGDVRRGDVQRLVDELVPSMSGSRVRTVVNAIRSLYAWALDRELAAVDPAARIRLPAMEATPRDRVATVEEITGLLGALKLEDALPYALAVYATARRGEIRHLTVGDVDLDVGVLYLGADERGRKSRAAQRAVPIVRPLAVMIRRRLLERGRPAAGELLCPGHKTGGRNSGMLSFEGLQTRVDLVWEPRDKKTGEPIPGAKIGERITAHECRHTCISWMDAAGIRPSVISQIAGHSMRTDGAAVTSRYTHTLPGDIERAREHLDAFLAVDRIEATG